MPRLTAVRNGSPVVNHLFAARQANLRAGALAPAEELKLSTVFFFDQALGF